MIFRLVFAAIDLQTKFDVLSFTFFKDCTETKILYINGLPDSHHAHLRVVYHV